MPEFHISDWDFKRWSETHNDPGQFKVGDMIRVKQISFISGRKETREGVVSRVDDEVTTTGHRYQQININWSEGGSQGVPSNVFVKLDSKNYFADLTVTSIDFVEELINETEIAATRESLLGASGQTRTEDLA